MRRPGSTGRLRPNVPTSIPGDDRPPKPCPSRGRAGRWPPRTGAARRQCRAERCEAKVVFLWFFRKLINVSSPRRLRDDGQRGPGHYLGLGAAKMGVCRRAVPKPSPRVGRFQKQRCQRGRLRLRSSTEPPQTSGPRGGRRYATLSWREDRSSNNPRASIRAMGASAIIPCVAAPPQPRIPRGPGPVPPSPSPLPTRAGTVLNVTGVIFGVNVQPDDTGTSGTKPPPALPRPAETRNLACVDASAVHGRRTRSI